MRLIIKTFPLALLLLSIAAGCETVDDERIPASPVRIPFNTLADWETYGIKGALDYRYFIIEEGLPVNYPYTSLTHTGFGGILLCGDIHGNALAFDLSCPVERNKAVRITVNDENTTARCQGCGSEFDIFSNNGTPVSGEAARLGYGLTRYQVYENTGNEYRLITH